MFGEEDIINKSSGREFSVACTSFEGEVLVICKNDFIKILNNKKSRKIIMANLQQKQVLHNDNSDNITTNFTPVLSYIQENKTKREEQQSLTQRNTHQNKFHNLMGFGNTDFFDQDQQKPSNSLPKKISSFSKYKFIDNTFDENTTMFNLNDSIEQAKFKMYNKFNKPQYLNNQRGESPIYDSMLVLLNRASGKVKFEKELKLSQEKKVIPKQEFTNYLQYKRQSLKNRQIDASDSHNVSSIKEKKEMDKKRIIQNFHKTLIMKQNETLDIQTMKFMETQFKQSIEKQIMNLIPRNSMLQEKYKKSINRASLDLQDKVHKDVNSKNHDISKTIYQILSKKYLQKIE